MKKILLAALLLVAAPCVCKALIRNGNHTPVLHSVFDRVLPAPPPFNMEVPPAGSPRYRRQLSAESYNHRHIGGIVMLSIGGAVLAGGLTLTAIGLRDEREQSANGGRSYAFTEWFPGILLAIASLGLVIPGAILLTKYPHRHKQD